jgi:hypothetical protein
VAATDRHSSYCFGFGAQNQRGGGGTVLLTHL